MKVAGLQFIAAGLVVGASLLIMNYLLERSAAEQLHDQYFVVTGGAPHLYIFPASMIIVGTAIILGSSALARLLVRDDQ